jgi:hypothetical protein
MKKLFFLLLIILFVLQINNVFAVETGQYRYYKYGQDFNISDFIIDINGQIDTDFSADCNLIGKYDITGEMVFDNNVMQDDPIVAGLKYLFVPASNTTTWKKGKYSVIETCVDYNNYGSENVSFILDVDYLDSVSDTNTYLGNLIRDTNAIGRGLNSDQNQLLFDINSSVSKLIDNDAPIIVFNSPTNYSITSSGLTSFDIYDASKIIDVNVIINGVQSVVFDVNADCLLASSPANCSYTESFVLNAYNDINVVVRDKWGFVGYSDANFYFVASTANLSGVNGGGPFANLAHGRIFRVNNDENVFVINYVLNESGYVDFVLTNVSNFFVLNAGVSDSDGLSWSFLSGNSFGAKESKVVRLFYDFNNFVGDKNFVVVFDSGLTGTELTSVKLVFVRNTGFLSGFSLWVSSGINVFGLLIPLWVVLVLFLVFSWFFVTQFFDGTAFVEILLLSLAFIVVLVGVFV